MSGFVTPSMFGPCELYGSRPNPFQQIAPTASAFGDEAGSVTLPAARLVLDRAGPEHEHVEPRRARRPENRTIATPILLGRAGVRVTEPPRRAVRRPVPSGRPRMSATVATVAHPHEVEVVVVGRRRPVVPLEGDAGLCRHWSIVKRLKMSLRRRRRCRRRRRRRSCRSSGSGPRCPAALTQRIPFDFASATIASGVPAGPPPSPRHVSNQLTEWLTILIPCALA